jgi:hypothetical protein
VEEGPTTPATGELVRQAPTYTQVAKLSLEKPLMVLAGLPSWVTNTLSQPV